MHKDPQHAAPRAAARRSRSRRPGSSPPTEYKLLPAQTPVAQLAGAAASAQRVSVRTQAPVGLLGVEGPWPHTVDLLEWRGRGHTLAAARPPWGGKWGTACLPSAALGSVQWRIDLLGFGMKKETQFRTWQRLPTVVPLSYRPLQGRPAFGRSGNESRLQAQGGGSPTGGAEERPGGGRRA
ncbi:uncharacterized protein LOC117063063 [Trachypithecus francoisi]|uniref:uncharacterized protein LOC117063063 n=1 Tax=Trachypithecus francoisi TaxID=54180 RepID=UPI00141BBD77|nr:uncharacterized protein LOC117063063 [Trachypithecus francoisi]